MTPDVNVLVSAYRADHPHHRLARAWLDDTLRSCGSGGTVEILPMVAAGFLRLVTNPKVFPVVVSSTAALRYLDEILESPGATLTDLGKEWPAFERLCQELNLAGNDIPDAWIAAAVITNGLHLVTFDRGFARLLRPAQYTLLTPAGVQERKARYAVRRPQRLSRRARV